MITAICSIITTLLSIGMTVMGVVDTLKITSHKREINQLVAAINNALHSKDRDALLNAVMQNNSNQIQNILMANPVSGRKISEIMEDQKVLTDLSSKINSTKSALNDIIYEAQSRQKVSMFDNTNLDDLTEKKTNLEKQLNDYNKQVDDIAKKGSKSTIVKPSSGSGVKQNLNGGLN